jgi:hypothetical protein
MMVCIIGHVHLSILISFLTRYPSKSVTFESHHVSMYNRTFGVGVVDLSTVTVGNCISIGFILLHRIHMAMMKFPQSYSK